MGRNDQVKRQLKDKLKKARKFTQDVGKKQGAIEGLVARRVNLERKKQIVKVGKKQQRKEVALLNAVKQRMTQLKKKEIKDLSKRVKKEIKSEKKKASGEAKTMMRTLINAKKLTPYDDFGKKECSIKENFCGKCCAHHIGSTFLLKLNKCKSQCGNLLKGRLKKTKKKGKKGKKGKGKKVKRRN